MENGRKKRSTNHGTYRTKTNDKCCERNEAFARECGTYHQASRGIISVTHTTISHFETGRRDFPSLRIEQLVKGYGYTMEEFEKILGHRSVISHKDDCVTMIGQLDDDQLSAIRSVLSQMLRNSRKAIVANETLETQQ